MFLSVLNLNPSFGLFLYWVVGRRSEEHDPLNTQWKAPGSTYTMCPQLSWRIYCTV
uniref:Uncharacterized protein n=1 Tax=Esox lucius TaxID=8010 RepID=A0A6Q2Z5P1_ESOLU